MNVSRLTNTQKLARIRYALDQRQRGLLDAESLVVTLLAILEGTDPYGGQEAA